MDTMSLIAFFALAILVLLYRSPSEPEEASTKYRVVWNGHAEDSAMVVGPDHQVIKQFDANVYENPRNEALQYCTAMNGKKPKQKTA